MPKIQSITVPETDCLETKAAFDRALYELRRLLAEIDVGAVIDIDIAERLARRSRLPAVPRFLARDDSLQRQVEARADKLSDALSRLPDLSRFRPLDGYWAKLLTDEIAKLIDALDALEAARRARDAAALDADGTEPPPLAAEESATAESKQAVTRVDDSELESEAEPQTEDLAQTLETEAEAELEVGATDAAMPIEPVNGDAGDAPAMTEPPPRVSGPPPRPAARPEPTAAAPEPGAAAAKARSGVVVPLHFKPEDRPVNAAIRAEAKRPESEAETLAVELEISEAETDDGMSIPDTGPRPLIEEEPPRRPLTRRLMSVLVVCVLVGVFALGFYAWKSGYVLNFSNAQSDDGRQGTGAETSLTGEAAATPKVTARVEPTADKPGSGRDRPSNAQAKSQQPPPPVEAAPTATPETVASSPPPPLPLKRAVAETPQTEQTAAPAQQQTASANPAPESFSQFDGKFAAQIGSYQSQELADAGLAQFRRRFPEKASGQTYEFKYVTIPGKGDYVRVRLGPFATRDEASAFCFAITSAGGGCIVAAP